MRVGTTLPQFRGEAATAIAAARRAEEVGLDGVFVFDHMWPIGNRDGEVLHSFSLLGALTTETERVRLGSLVARVGLVPDAVLVNQFASMREISGDRLIAGMGTGDDLSKAENDAYGVAYESAEERLQAVARNCAACAERGIETWVGGRSAEVRAVAGAHASALNVWQATPAAVVEEGEDLRRHANGRKVEITWAGQVLIGRSKQDAAERLERKGTRPGLVHGTVDDVVRHLKAIADAGATWAVCAPLDIGDDHDDALEMLAEVKKALA